MPTSFDFDEDEVQDEFEDEFDDVQEEEEMEEPVDDETFEEESIHDSFRDSFDESVTSPVPSPKKKVELKIEKPQSVPPPQKTKSPKATPQTLSKKATPELNSSINLSQSFSAMPSSGPVNVLVDMNRYETALREVNAHVLEVKQMFSFMTTPGNETVSKENYERMEKMFNDSLSERDKLMKVIEDLRITAQKLETENKTFQHKELDHKQDLDLEVKRVKLEQDNQLQKIKLQGEQELQAAISEVKLEHQTQLQKAVLEAERFKEDLRAREDKQRKEIEDLKTKFDKDLEGEMERMHNEYLLKERQKESEKKHLQQLFQLEKDAMERRQKEVLEEQKKSMREDFERQKKYLNIDEELASLIKKVDLNVKNVDTLHSRVNEEQIHVIQKREEQLAEKEKVLLSLEQGVSEQNAQLEKERARLNTLFASFETRMFSLQKSFEEERFKCQQEQAKLESERMSLHVEYESKIKETYSLREKLDKERSEYLIDKQNFLKRTHDDRAEISQKQSDLSAKEESFIQERARIMRELTQAKSDITLMKTEVEKEYALMEERRKIIEQERKNLQDSKQQLDKEREGFKSSVDDLTQTAIQVQRDSENIVKLRQEIAKEKQDCVRLREEVEQIRQHSVNQDKKSQMEIKQIQTQRKSLEQERIDMIKSRKELQEERNEISSKIDRLRSLEYSMNEQMALATYTNQVVPAKITFNNYVDVTDDYIPIGNEENLDEVEKSSIGSLSPELTEAVPKYTMPPVVQQQTATSNSFSFYDEMARWAKERMRSNLLIKEQNQFLEGISNQQQLTSPKAKSNLLSSTLSSNTFSFIPLQTVDSISKTDMNSTTNRDSLAVGSDD
jgi:hypothetical protein